MAKIMASFRKNLIIYIEGIFYLLLLGLNIFIGYHLYQNVVLDIRPVVPAAGEPVPVKITSLNTAGLNVFEENQVNRKFFIIGIDETYTKRWENFQNPADPFLR